MCLTLFGICRNNFCFLLQKKMIDMEKIFFEGAEYQFAIEIIGRTILMFVLIIVW